MIAYRAIGKEILLTDLCPNIKVGIKMSCKFFIQFGIYNQMNLEKKEHLIEINENK